MQIAVVDSDDVDAKGCCEGDLLFGDGLGEDVEAEGIGKLLEFGVGLIINDGHHEQDCIGTEIARGINLNRIDDEVLAQHGEVRGECHGL